MLNSLTATRASRGVRSLAASSLAGAAVLALLAGSAFAGPTGYEIYDLGVLDPGDFGSQGFGVSANGVAVGRTLGVSNQGYMWTPTGGTVGLPNLSTHPFGRAEDANDAGQVVGIGAQTSFGSGAVPVIWNNGVISQLSLPPGEGVGRAYSINASGVAVGSAGGGSLERGVIYSGNSVTEILVTTSGGATLTTAFGINDSGLIVGNGLDPNNFARNVGFVYDSVTGIATEVGALPGGNGALAFGVSNAGHVVGSSSLNQASGMPYIWTATGGMVAIPLPPGTSSGSARDVNADGWAVGIASGVFAVPFLYDGTQTYTIQELLPEGSGWDVSMNTSSGALGISDSGVIVGTGLLNGEVRAYAMIPVPSGCEGDFNGSGAADIFDILDFLAAWEAGDPATDRNDNGQNDIFDILDFLGVWELGCP